LNRDTDLVLQEPVRNREGELVSSITADDGRVVHCTLLRWVEGIPYQRDLEMEETARQIGAILATLHNHASRWQIPTGFKRPRRDIPYFREHLDSLLPAVADGYIDQAHYAELSKSIAILTKRMKDLNTSSEHYGILHADAHKGNMLLHEGQIRLIDFSFCAFGHYMFDLGICLGDMKPELHQHCLAGYCSLRALPDGYQELIEGFLLGSAVGAFSFWVANPRTQELLAVKLPQITENFAVKFNRGERFWFPDTRA
jgi:Ser/Thr protein kinase RdoA (MazF antagonist)